MFAKLFQMAFNSSRQILVVSGGFCQCLIAPGCSRRVLVVSGSFWWFITFHRCSSLLLAAPGGSSLVLAATCGFLRRCRSYRFLLRFSFRAGSPARFSGAKSLECGAKSLECGAKSLDLGPPKVYTWHRKIAFAEIAFCWFPACFYPYKHPPPQMLFLVNAKSYFW